MNKINDYSMLLTGIFFILIFFWGHDLLGDLIITTGAAWQQLAALIIWCAALISLFAFRTHITTLLFPSMREYYRR